MAWCAFRAIDGFCVGIRFWEMPLHGERFLIHGPREIHDIVAKQNKFALDTIA